MRQEIKDASRKNLRAMNSEIISRIELALGYQLPDMEFSNPPGRGSEQVMLRMPDGLRERIKASAKTSGRSMNEEIARRLAYADVLLRGGEATTSVKPRPIQPQDKYVLRLPDGMRDRLKAAAEANNRSMNAEIVSILERHFSAKTTDSNAAIEAAISSIRAEIARISSHQR